MAASYLKKAFDPVLLRRIALETYRVMQQTGAEVVVARGLSGTVVATAMAALFSTPYAIVRKDDEENHSSNSLEVHTDPDIDGPNPFDRMIYENWIIVDDLILTGRTMAAIGKGVGTGSWRTITGKCVGIALYANGGSSQSHKRYWPINGIDAPIFDVGKVDD